MDSAFDPNILAQDIDAVRANYAAFFAQLTDADWARPSPRGKDEWNLRETVAHLGALTGTGNQSMLAALRGEKYPIPGLTNRFAFTRYNRAEIDRRLDLSNQALAAAFLETLAQARQIAFSLRADQFDCAASFPIYNRPARVVEALGIQVSHPGLHHAAQVAEPAGVSPLWMQLPPPLRHRIVSRVMRALSLLYRYDLGCDLTAVFAFVIAGEGGGAWHVDVSPTGTQSDQGRVEKADVTLHLRSTDTFCRMFTGRIKLLGALLSGELRISGNLRLFLRFGSLFSVDARK